MKETTQQRSTRGGRKPQAKRARKGDKQVAPKGDKHVALKGDKQVAPKGDKHVALKGDKQVAPKGNKHVALKGDKQVAPKGDKQEALMLSRIQGLKQTLSFRQFLGASFEPVISDAEIVVCFADVRGFTDYCRRLQQEMQDRKIQNFLRTYLKIFNEGLMSWYVKHLDQEYGEIDKNIAMLADHVVPKMYKNLGDGLMMVWEIPSTLSLQEQGNLAQQIVFAVDEIVRWFYIHFRELTPIELDSYSKEVLKLDLGCGIAKGHAWRLDFGHSLDYAGSIINLASRLESRARPQGVVAHYDVSTWMFNTLVSKGQGHLVEIEGIKGYGTVRAWLSSEVNHDQSGFKAVIVD